jgi:hypothetical protein
MDDLDDALRRLVAAYPKDNLRYGPADLLEFEGDPAWVFDLISTDDRVRGRALARHQALLEAAREANHWINRVWAQAGTPAPEAPHLAAEMEQARAAHRHYVGQTIFELLGGCYDTDQTVRERHARYALLYLVWERHYPAEWRMRESNAWSPWPRKEGLLMEMAEKGIPASILPQMADLLPDVVAHPYRCKDWLYAPLARQLRGGRFDERMRDLLVAADPMVRSRAQFVLHVADTPTLTVKRHTFDRWLTDKGMSRATGCGDSQRDDPADGGAGPRR